MKFPERPLRAVEDERKPTYGEAGNTLRETLYARQASRSPISRPERS